jgi:hypothetical protein
VEGGANAVFGHMVMILSATTDEMAKGRNGNVIWAKWERAKWERAKWEDTHFLIKMQSDTILNTKNIPES